MGCGASKASTSNSSEGDRQLRAEATKEQDKKIDIDVVDDVKQDGIVKEANNNTGDKGKTAPKSSAPTPSPAPPPPPPPPPASISSGTKVVPWTEESKKQDGEIKKDSEKPNLSALRSKRFLIRRQKTKLGIDAPRGDSPLIKQLMQGDLSAQCPSNLKTVRIFVSSTFTDTQHERNWLMEKVYPRLKEFCQSHGYDFQVVDMRWGIRDVAQDDHTTTEICLQEVELCKTQSTGPCFLSLASHKYGYRDFPRKIPEDDFNKLIDHIDNEDVKDAILQWFKKDENEVPGTYVLQPISVNLPDFKSDVSEIRSGALMKWYTIRSEIHTALADAAAKVLCEKAAEIFIRSVTEAETMSCLSNAPKENVLWFRRIIRNIDEVDAEAEAKILRRFRDLTNDPLKDAEAKRLLTQFEEEKMKHQMDQANIKEYEVQWQPGKGIDPEANESHRKYLGQLCTDVETHVKSLIQVAFNKREQIGEGNSVFQEVLQHTTFCQKKCDVFYGRDESLKQIQKYLEGPSNAPYVVHGPSGSGKTSLMAMTVQLANKIFGNNAMTIFRFLGTTPDSTTLPNLMISIITQMKLAVGREIRNDLSNLTTKQLLAQYLLTSVSVSKVKKLVIVLDSLDQLDPSHEAHQMQWLRTVFTKNIKVVVSTLPEEQYGILQVLENKLKDHPPNFLAVPSLSDADTVGILDKWLATANRTLTQYQRNYVVQSFHQCPLPLYLKLTFDQASQWKSYQPENLTLLQTTVRGCINELFDKLEDFHGKIFVSKALGYLTASQTGLSEAELEDVLSCDEDVLGDVYRFWTPPLRRLPPLLLIRMKRDLGQYVVYRGADGKQVFYWYHRQFIEAAYDRYCSDPEVLKQLHQGLADYFAGSWAEGRCKPYLDKDKVESKANRYVASQPHNFGSELNERKLNRQAYHRAMAGQLEHLKSECLINYKFVVSKLDCTGLRTLLDDFRMARNLFPDDEELEGISDALQLSQHALSYDLRTLPSQILGRITNSKIQKLPSVSTFLADCRTADHMYLQPDSAILTPAGGQLVHDIAENSDSINCLALNKAGTIAVTSADDNSIKTFDVHQGRLLKSFKGVAKDVDNMKLACNDSLIIINGKDSISAFDLDTGSKKWNVKTGRNSHFTVGGKDQNTVVLFRERTYGFYNAENGQLINDMKVLPGSVPMKVSLSQMGPSVGQENWAVTVDDNQTIAFVFDIATQSVIKYNRIMKIYRDEDNEKVEPTIDGLQISHDGETLYVANYMDNDLHFVNIRTLEIEKTLTGCKHDFSDKFHLSLDGKYLYFPSHSFIRVWDLSTGKKATLFNGPDNKGLEDVFSCDMETFVTSCGDRNVKIWNVNRGDNPGLIFEDLSVDFRAKTNTANVQAFIPTESSYLYLMVWKEGEGEKNMQIVSLYDVSTSSFLRQYHHKYKESKEAMSSIKYLKNWQIMFEMNDRARILDLKTMKVKTTFQGVLPSYCSDFMAVSNETELACVSRGRMNLKIMNCATGKSNFIIKAGQTKRIDNLIANTSGSIIIADCDGPFLVFNITKRICEFKISPSDTRSSDTELYLSDSYISPDGSYFLFQAEYKLEKKFLAPGVKEGDSVTSVHVFNLQSRTQEQVLVDYEMYNHYKRINQTEREVYFDTFKVLDDSRLLSAHDDYILRVFDYKAGSLLQRLEGHMSYIEISYNLGNDIFLSHGMWSEEYGIRLWDTKNFECLAVYSYDFDMKDFSIIDAEPCRVISLLKSDVQPVLFSLRGEGSEQLKIAQTAQPPKGNIPKFEKSGVGELDLSDPVDIQVLDADNPDSDEEEKDDDDDDDDDIDDDIEEDDDDDWLNN